MSTERSRSGLAPRWAASLLLALFVLQPALGLAQERPPYILGETKGLEMIVHIIGEVQKPGEYRVPDQTNILELLSKAGGPTQLSRLGQITVRRSVGLTSLASSGGAEAASQVEILNVDLDRSMRDKTAPPLALRPADVVFVPRNGRQTWLDVSAVVRDLSIVASSYFLYLRATK